MNNLLDLPIPAGSPRPANQPSEFPPESAEAEAALARRIQRTVSRIQEGSDSPDMDRSALVRDLDAITFRGARVVLTLSKQVQFHKLARLAHYNDEEENLLICWLGVQPWGKIGSVMSDPGRAFGLVMDWVDAQCPTPEIRALAAMVGDAVWIGCEYVRAVPAPGIPTSISPAAEGNAPGRTHESH